MASAGPGFWPPPDRNMPVEEGRLMPRYLPSSDSDGMDLFRKLWRRKGMIVAAAAAGGLLAGSATLLMTPRYTAESRVLIGVELPNVSNYPGLLQDVTANQEVVQSESYVLTSRNLANQVAHRMALDQDPEFNPWLREPPAWRPYLDTAKSWAANVIAEIAGPSDENAADPPTLTEEDRRERIRQVVVGQVLARLEVIPLQRSHVLSINAQSENPETAARLANTVARTYIEQQMIRRTRVTKDATAWFDTRIAELRTKVETAERAVEEYRRTHGLFETRNDKVTAQQLNELNTQLIMAEAERASAEARLAQAQQAQSNPGAIASLPAVVNSPLIQSLMQRRIETERQAAELGSTFGPQHPRRRDINAQLAEIRGRIAQEVEKVVQAVGHEVQAVRSRVQTLRSNLAEVEGQMGTDNENAIRLRELERRAEADRRLLVDFLNRAKETEAQPNSDAQSSVIISEATMPFAPSYPPSNMLILLGMIGGTLLGMVVALMRENLDRTFRTARQFEESTNLPVLGVLPSSNPRPVGRAATHLRAENAFDQAIGNLLERLAFAPETQGRKLLMLTSATPREGKTRIAVELVRMMAQRGLRAIILDCDWRRPSINRYFSQAATPGLGDLLAGAATPDEVVYRDAHTGVHAIFAGDMSLLPHTAERFYRLRMLQATLARHYDIVIIDTPPVLVGPEALVLGRMSEEVAFVVRWGHTSRDVAMDAIRNLALNGARIGGAILSDVNRNRYREYASGDVVYPYAAAPASRPA